MGEHKHKEGGNLFAALTKEEIDRAQADAQELSAIVISVLDWHAKKWQGDGASNLEISARLTMLMPAILGSAYATIATAHGAGLGFLTTNWPMIQRQAHRHFAAGMAEYDSRSKPPH